MSKPSFALVTARSCRRMALGLFAASLCTGGVHGQDQNDYKLGPDSQFNPEVPHGDVVKRTHVSGPQGIFPGTVRDYWVYVPKQYDGQRPASLMVFQDGGGYVSTNGSWRAPWVFDNLIAKKEMPVTIGVFINPGVVPALNTTALPRYNRSLEYDGLGDTYARFLAEELLPEVQRDYLITIDPNGRGIAGSSSGAIAAFTAAWERPDLFRRVFSTIGTYVGLRGGQNYPILVRKFEPRPLRIFLQDGYNDQNIYGGNWWIANQDMYSALQWAGYDVRKEWGTGGHDAKQGGAIFPEAMRWLWRDYPAPIEAGYSTNGPLRQITISGEDWQLVGKGYKFPGGLCANAKGEVFFADMPENRIFRVNLEGEVTVYRSDVSGAQGLAVRGDGQLVATVPASQRLVAYNGRDAEMFLATDTGCKELTISHDGTCYFTDPDGRSVKRIGPNGAVIALDTGIEFPSGICLTPDQSLLLVSSVVSQFVYSFQIQTDGSLANRQAYFHLHLPDDPRGSGADGMCVDADGRLYVCTHLGIQICDQAGRVNAILRKPESGVWASDICLGGKNQDELFVTAGDKVWKRKLRVKSALPFQDPIVPKKPVL